MEYVIVVEEAYDSKSLKEMLTKATFFSRRVKISMARGQSGRGTLQVTTHHLSEAENVTKELTKRGIGFKFTQIG